MLEVLNDFDWEEAFKYAENPRAPLPSGDYDLSSFTREDVTDIAGIREGENDEEDWLVYGRLRDGRWFFLSAWCDYTGWG